MEEEKKIQDEASEMAESSHKKPEATLEENKAENISKSDEELDVTSEVFNPLKALYAPDYRVTQKQPKIVYQNMAAFETALKKVGIMGLNSKARNEQPSGSSETKNKKTLVREEQTQRRFKDYQMPIKTEIKVKKKHHRNLIMQMSQSEGPFKKLQEWVLNERSVKVIVRKEHGIKGYVEGKIKMFDRHWNLLLVDVLECLEMRKYKYAENKLVMHTEPQDCSELLKNLGIKLPEQSVKSLGRKKVEIKRHLPQLMLRGEHVVLMSAKVIELAK